MNHFRVTAHFREKCIKWPKMTLTFSSCKVPTHTAYIPEANFRPFYSMIGHFQIKLWPDIGKRASNDPKMALTCSMSKLSVCRRQGSEYFPAKTTYCSANTALSPPLTLSPIRCATRIFCCSHGTRRASEGWIGSVRDKSQARRLCFARCQERWLGCGLLCATRRSLGVRVRKVSLIL